MRTKISILIVLCILLFNNRLTGQYGPNINLKVFTGFSSIAEPSIFYDARADYYEDLKASGLASGFMIYPDLFKKIPVKVGLGLQSTKYRNWTADASSNLPELEIDKENIYKGINFEINTRIYSTESLEVCIKAGLTYYLMDLYLGMRILNVPSSDTLIVFTIPEKNELYKGTGYYYGLDVNYHLSDFIYVAAQIQNSSYNVPDLDYVTKTFDIFYIQFGVGIKFLKSKAVYK